MKNYELPDWMLGKLHPRDEMVRYSISRFQDTVREAFQKECSFSLELNRREYPESKVEKIVSDIQMVIPELFEDALDDVHITQTQVLELVSSIKVYKLQSIARQLLTKILHRKHKAIQSEEFGKQWSTELSVQKLNKAIYAKKHRKLHQAFWSDNLVVLDLPTLAYVLDEQTVLEDCIELGRKYDLLKMNGAEAAYLHGSLDSEYLYSAADNYVRTWYDKKDKEFDYAGHAIPYYIYGRAIETDTNLDNVYNPFDYIYEDVEKLRSVLLDA